MTVILLLLLCAFFYFLGKYRVLHSADYASLLEDAEAYREVMDQHKDYDHE